MQNPSGKIQGGRKPVRVGFVPLCDCAPLVMAQELGLFEKHGVAVQLSREVGWATVRDKIIYGELDAAHALAPMIFAANLGLGSIPAECVTGLVFSPNGNAITVTESVWHGGAQAGGLPEFFARKKSAPFIFGVPFLFSAHYFLLQAWLRSCGLNPQSDVQCVVVPPPQMAANLKAGHLHGYCVGEPWNSVAALAGFGRRVVTGMEIAPGHPEKILLARRAFAESRPEEHQRLIAALVEACRFCSVPGNRERIVETLGEPQYVNAPAPALRAGCELALSNARATDDALNPSLDKAAWVIEQLRSSQLLPDAVKLPAAAVSKIFRTDLFNDAVVSLDGGRGKKMELPAEKFISGSTSPAAGAKTASLLRPVKPATAKF